MTAEDEFETLSQRLLSASLKLARPPNMCVAVESTPEGVTAAHNCSMKAIGVQVGRGGGWLGDGVCGHRARYKAGNQPKASAAPVPQLPPSPGRPLVPLTPPQGPYRAYQLQTADLTCSSLAELKIYNIRRLFVSR